MVWDDDKSTAADPDNPTADEQLTATEWDNHVADQKGHSTRHEAGGSDEITDLNLDSLSGLTFIRSGQDAQSIIESAGVNSHIILEPGSTFDIVPPFDPPANIFLNGGPSSTLDGGASDSQLVGANVRFRKAGNGNMVNVPDNFWAQGILFDGQSSTYTGDGLSDANWDTQGTRLIGCRIQNMAGAGRVHDAAAYCYYENLRIWDCGGAAIKNTTTNSDGYRRSTINGMHIDNCQHAILTESSERYTRYINLRTASTTEAAIRYTNPVGESISYVHIDGQITNPAGPGIHATGHFVTNYTVTGKITGADDPAIYYDGTGGLRQWHLAVDISNCAGAVSVPFTAPLGQCIHIEGSGSQSELTTGTCGWGQQDHTSNSVMSNQSANDSHFVTVDTVSGGSTTADGNLALVCVNIDKFDPGNTANFNGNNLKNVT